MYGLQKYLTQSDELIRLWYSEILYQSSVTSGVTQVATINYGEYGAKVILISGMIISSGAVAGAANLVTFRDQFNRVLFSIDGSREGNGFIEFQQVLPGQSFTITASFAVPIADYNFTVKHQYLREVDKSTKAKF